QPTTIAHLVQHLAPGGIEAMVVEMQRMATDSEEVHIISLESRFTKASAQWPLLTTLPRIHFLDKPPGLSFQVVKDLCSLLRNLKVSVIHTHHAGPLLYGGAAAMLVRCRHIHTEHDAWHLLKMKRRLLVTACLHFFRPKVVAVAQQVANSIQKHIPCINPGIISNGVNCQRFSPGNQRAARQLLGLPAEAPIIGCAARLTNAKNHHVLLKAFAGLPESVHLALAGNGELESELKSLASQLNITSRLHWLGVIEDMPAFYRAINLLCMTSRNEGLPLAPLEAQACGTPVVITDVGGSREAVDPNSGLLVKAQDHQLIHNVLSHYLETASNPELKQSARYFVLDGFNITNTIYQYHTLYKEGTLK
ncbi:MAG: glycosyltransferase, partial [Endozoicomonas sp.]